MHTIYENVSNEIVIKNSKFICLLYKVYSEDDVKKHYKMAKDTYKNATHYCYSYVIDGITKFFDDNEPGGTAGNPMLNILLKNDLNYILAIVIRYFGGIKLGANGLIRAYSKSVSNALDKTSILNLIPAYNINITFDYDNINIINNILNNEIIINKSFEDKVIYNINTTNEVIEKLKKYAKVDIIKDVYIEKNS